MSDRVLQFVAERFTASNTVLLAVDGERHLVIVRYPPKYSWTTGEWVYNEADIDDAKVVWTREMDAEQNRKLLEYFQGQAGMAIGSGPESPPF
jgi:hypothetical protein